MSHLDSDSESSLQWQWVISTATVSHIYSVSESSLVTVSHLHSDSESYLQHQWVISTSAPSHRKRRRHASCAARLMSRLDYCNSVLEVFPADAPTTARRLEHHCMGHVWPHYKRICTSCQFLQRLQYKLCLMMCNSPWPPYLSNTMQSSLLKHHHAHSLGVLLIHLVMSRRRRSLENEPSHSLAQWRPSTYPTTVVIIAFSARNKNYFTFTEFLTHTFLHNTLSFSVALLRTYILQCNRGITKYHDNKQWWWWWRW